MWREPYFAFVLTIWLLVDWEALSHLEGNMSADFVWEQVSSFRKTKLAMKFSHWELKSHDRHVQNVLESETPANIFGVKGTCVLSESLQHFHPISGFPPDLLHDLLEGTVPVELALCLKEMIRLKLFSLDHLKDRIASFQYKHTDKVNSPQTIPKSFMSRATIGGNAHLPLFSDCSFFLMVAKYLKAVRSGLYWWSWKMLELALCLSLMALWTT